MTIALILQRGLSESSRSPVSVLQVEEHIANSGKKTKYSQRRRQGRQVQGQRGGGGRQQRQGDGGGQSQQQKAEQAISGSRRARKVPKKRKIIKI